MDFCLFSSSLSFSHLISPTVSQVSTNIYVTHFKWLTDDDSGGETSEIESGLFTNSSDGIENDTDGEGGSEGVDDPEALEVLSV